jgi:hypothetical protein
MMYWFPALPGPVAAAAPPAPGSAAARARAPARGAPRAKP